MSDFKEISNIVEEKLKQFQYEIPINIKFSNFSKEFDVQINELVQIVKDSNFNVIAQEIKDSFEESSLPMIAEFIFKCPLVSAMPELNFIEIPFC